ncbi:MAG: class I mannose-6-phosphate isomerase, partial [Chloroflexi bacterium]|nr:class I mannose-6-phosphate isomerase [Chloroflexota bacterium]
MSYYPLLLNAISIEKIWGGRNLEKLFAKNLPPNQLIGETWEAWEGCEIANGNYAGQQLERVVERDPVGFLGTRDKRFPLLFKFIDAQKDLSVQVHPDDRAAQKLENYPFGKTEAWYILAAEPNAHLFVGFQRDTTSAQIRAAIANQSLVDLLQPVPVQRGDVVFVPAGT